MKSGTNAKPRKARPCGPHNSRVESLQVVNDRHLVGPEALWGCTFDDLHPRMSGTSRAPQARIAPIHG